MKKLRLLVVSLLAMTMSCSLVLGQYTINGFCCDPTSSEALDPSTCNGASEGFEFGNADSIVDDCDCSDADGPACIPIDGGLSLLALAGGGLATAAMRRRREGEEAAAQGAS